ncbi:hypothetical protein NQ317_012115 [Molorchus minor]|uniref:DUF7041 domain-containing protein n=1 Tax=Molorchus minor TaxID=1323400 RepID=A0ABQ9ISG2_9CUCU|nr:hypothetical protein NQ317_012115 [Molorchus minor]
MPNTQVPEGTPISMDNELEAQFLIAGTKQDSTKFGYVVGHLDRRQMEEVEDIISNPPAERKYEAIKGELIKRLSDASSQRVRKLLESEELGDRTPSQFLQHLRQLAGKNVPDEFIKTPWMNRLPTSTQRVLAVSTEQSLTRLAELADRVHEIDPGRNRVSQVSENTEPPVQASTTAMPACQMTALRQEIQQLKTAIREIFLDKGRRRQRSRHRNYSRGRGTNSRERRDDSERNDVCWYHRRFGAHARKCRAPCKSAQRN